MDDGIPEEMRGWLALRAVGVNLAQPEIGVNVTSGIPLSGAQLALWARWVTDAPRVGIRNKPAFCAAKIRLGFSLDDVFPDISRRRSVEKEQCYQKREVEREEERQLDAALRADAAILAMQPEERQALRARALDDGAVWHARDLSPELLARVIQATEPTLTLGETQMATVRRDHTAYKGLPPL